jgi:hypothetical protein
MKNLLEIARVVTKRKVRKIEIFDDHSLRNNKSKFNQFYEALRDSKFKNDREAANALYKCSPTDPKYRQLKSRFRKRLLNTLFFLDINMPKAANYDRAYYSCHKDWTLVKTLIWYNAPNSAAQLARQILTTSLKFKFADLIINSSRILRDYAAQQGDERSYEEYDNYIKEYNDILGAEIRSEELLQRVVMNYYKPLSKTQELAENIEGYCEALVSLSEQYDSPVIFYNMYLVWIFAYEMQQDFESMLEVCEQGEQFVQKNAVYKQHKKMVSFQTKKMSAYLHLRNYRDGRATAEQCLKELKTGTEDWFSFMDYYFLLAMHVGNILQSVTIFKLVFTNSKLRKQNNETVEKWKIYEGYIEYLIMVEGKEIPVLKKYQSKQFQPSRIISKPAVYSKEQRIFTVHMLILQVLFLFEERKFNDAIERIDRLKKYANRQLRREEYSRPVQFIRLLQQYAKSDFQPTEVTGTERYLNQLKDTPFFYRGVSDELEIIPYETLWEYVKKYER